MRQCTQAEWPSSEVEWMQGPMTECIQPLSILMPEVQSTRPGSKDCSKLTQGPCWSNTVEIHRGPEFAVCIRCLRRPVPRLTWRARSGVVSQQLQQRHCTEPCSILDDPDHQLYSIHSRYMQGRGLSTYLKYQKSSCQRTNCRISPPQPVAGLGQWSKHRRMIDHQPTAQCLQHQHTRSWPQPQAAQLF